MVISTLTHSVVQGVDVVTSPVTNLFRDTTIRLGVTGLSRAGKTVFITSLVANLLNRGRMPQLVAGAQGRIVSVMLQPQPDDTVARFDYEAHRDALLGSSPSWPDGTRTVSQLRLSFRIKPTGLLSGLSGEQTVHLDIVDYPGEWLLDLALLDQSYDEWSEASLATAQTRAQSQSFLDILSEVDPDAKFDDVVAGRLAGSYAGYLQAARAHGYADCTPGRFLLPGDLAGSPVLTFAPLPAGLAARRSLRAEMERRFEAYKSKVVRPFFRDHFARLDRQIVLVDVLKALAHGPRAVADLETAMTGILSAFRPGRNGFLQEIFRGKRIDRILFAATKADHIHHSQHDALSGLVTEMAQEARDRAAFFGAQTNALSLSALRTTTETTVADGLPAVQGIDAETGRARAYYPGEIPASAGSLLIEARERADEWRDFEFAKMRFAPPQMDIGANEGPPHIRLDRALQFLIGDKLG